MWYKELQMGLKKGSQIYGYTFKKQNHFLGKQYLRDSARALLKYKN